MALIQICLLNLLITINQRFKGIKKLDRNKAREKSYIPITVMKGNIDIIFYVLYHNFNNSLFDFEFPSKLKEADIAPVHKKEKKYLKSKLPAS